MKCEKESSRTLWKSLRDSHIPTASTTTNIYLLRPAIPAAKPQPETLPPQGVVSHVPGPECKPFSGTSNSETAPIPKEGSENERTFLAINADKLDDPQRLEWLPPGEVTAALELHPGMVVADVGAGTGYFALPIAQDSGSHPKVYAVDFQEEMLMRLGKKVPPALKNSILLIAGTAHATTLENNSCDIALLANLWHELDERSLVLKECPRILKRHGRIAVVDWRADVSAPPGPPDAHRIAAASVECELVAEGLALVVSRPIGLYSYLVIATID